MRSKLPFFLRNIQVILILILCIKIAGYFSIVQERGVNQVFKTISRMGMTISIVWIQLRLRKFGFVAWIKHERILAPFLYSIYLLLGLISFSWSTDWRYSTLQWLMTFESFVFTYAFLKVILSIRLHMKTQKLDLVVLFSWAIFPIMLAFLIGGFVSPDIFYRGMRGGEELRLGGWMMNPNELGMLSGISGALAFILLQKAKSRFWSLLMLFVAICVLLLTSSRSSTIGFAFILGVLIMKSQNRRLKRIMIAIGVIAIPVLINTIVFKADGGLEEVMSMTGRLPFWKALLDEGIVKEPFFGYGFMRISYTDYFQGMNTYAGKMTHNTFMQVLMNLGFVGFFIAFWQLVVTVMNFCKSKNNLNAPFFIAVFIPILINSFTEFGIFGETNYGILFYQFLIWLFVFEVKKNLSSRETVRLKLFYHRLRRFYTGNLDSQNENKDSK